MIAAAIMNSFFQASSTVSGCHSLEESCTGSYDYLESRIPSLLRKEALLTGFLLLQVLLKILSDVVMCSFCLLTSGADS